MSFHPFSWSKGDSVPIITSVLKKELSDDLIKTILDWIPFCNSCNTVLYNDIISIYCCKCKWNNAPFCWY